MTKKDSTASYTNTDADNTCGSTTDTTYKYSDLVLGYSFMSGKIQFYCQAEDHKIQGTTHRFLAYPLQNIEGKL